MEEALCLMYAQHESQSDHLPDGIIVPPHEQLKVGTGPQSPSAVMPPNNKILPGTLGSTSVVPLDETSVLRFGPAEKTSPGLVRLPTTRIKYVFEDLRMYMESPVRRLFQSPSCVM